MMKTAGIPEKIKLVIIQGPTASGKSELAVRLAEVHGGEIVNADSMQVYRGMDIGTAKPSNEMRARIPHHLLDLVDPDQPFSAADFRREAERVIQNIHDRGKKAVIVGGTGLYIKALTKGLVDSPGCNETIRQELEAVAGNQGHAELYRRLSRVDPAAAARIHPNDLVRIIRALEVFKISGRPISEFRDSHSFGEGDRYEYLKLGIEADRTELYRIIDQRVEWMMGHGLPEEVRGLLAKGYGPGLKSMRSLGYRHMCSFFKGEFTLEEATELIKRDTRRYAKRQLTWFRRDEEIKWFEYPANIAIISSDVIEFYDKGEGHGKSTV